MLLRVRPWPAPRPAPRESPDAAPNRRTLGPACHMLRDELRSGSAAQACPAGFLAPGHRRQTRGASYRRWRKKREGFGLWDWACKAPSWLLSVGWSGEQVGGIKGRVCCSQEESGCQPARMGLLRAADGGLQVSAALPGTELS